MNKDKRLKLYKDAEETWGAEAQYDQCIEEMAELIVAINKYKRNKFYNEEFDYNVKANLIEELADVYMCIEQLILMNNENRVFSVFEKKLDKLKGHLDNFKSKNE